MTRSQSVRLDMFRRVQKFGETYQSRFPEAAQSAPAFAVLSATIDALEADASATIANARDGRDASRAARRVLLRQLNAITRMARVIARTTPGFDGRFGRPRLAGSPSVVSTARAFLRDVEPVAATFIEHGLPADFVATLRAALAGFEAALGVRDGNRLSRASAFAGIRDAIRQGRGTVARIDVLVRYHFSDDAEMMAAWTRARQIDGQPQARPATPEPVSPPVPSSSDVTPAIEPAA